jgi:TRAP-type C4-dicarboxylate transport system substrate-binding protein
VGADDYKETHLLAVNVHGPGVLHTKNKPVKTVVDLRGMKLRGPSRQVTKMLGYLGAIPVGMPLPAIADALSKGTIDGCVLPWEVVPSVKVQELTRFHSEFDANVGALYTAAFVMTMNSKRYESLPADLKKIIDNNSGVNISGWMGKTQQGNDPTGKKSATDRGNTVYSIPASDAQEFKRKAALVEAEWMEDMSKRGLDGRALRDTARKLIDKYSKPGKA